MVKLVLLESGESLIRSARFLFGMSLSQNETTSTLEPMSTSEVIKHAGNYVLVSLGCIAGVFGGIILFLVLVGVIIYLCKQWIGDLDEDEEKNKEQKNRLKVRQPVSTDFGHYQANHYNNNNPLIPQHQPQQQRPEHKYAHHPHHFVDDFFSSNEPFFGNSVQKTVTNNNKSSGYVRIQEEIVDIYGCLEGDDDEDDDEDDAFTMIENKV